MTRFHALIPNSDRYTLCGKSVLDPGDDSVSDAQSPVNCKLCIRILRDQNKLTKTPKTIQLEKRER